MAPTSSRQQAFVLTGFSGRATPGRCTVLTFDRPGRWRRAGAAAGKWWGIALVCVLIPVAHLLLVPAFLLFGLYQFVRRLGTAELACDATGTCPDCGAEQQLELTPRWHAPQQVACVKCNRGLILSLPSGTTP